MSQISSAVLRLSDDGTLRTGTRGSPGYPTRRGGLEPCDRPLARARRGRIGASIVGNGSRRASALCQHSSRISDAHTASDVLHAAPSGLRRELRQRECALYTTWNRTDSAVLATVEPAALSRSVHTAPWHVPASFQLDRRESRTEMPAQDVPGIQSRISSKCVESPLNYSRLCLHIRGAS